MSKVSKKKARKTQPARATKKVAKKAAKKAAKKVTRKAQPAARKSPPPRATSKVAEKAAAKPAVAAVAAPPKALRMRPVIGHDNRAWWDRINEGQLPIQRCKKCGTLRHPPRPMCWKCQSLEWELVAASGKGTVYSYVVVHRPEIPGYTYPLVVAVVELEEGTRIVSNLVGIDPQNVEIGMPVKVSIEAVDDALKLPLFRPAR
jgi:uncharacterized OB-fold protein